MNEKKGERVLDDDGDDDDDGEGDDACTCFAHSSCTVRLMSAIMVCTVCLSSTAFSFHACKLRFTTLSMMV